ncbi:MAG: hypothetical protein KIG68_09605 [Oxalobacter sp.]|nr:hypothetical protein [Oxalobacter sp.]
MPVLELKLSPDNPDTEPDAMDINLIDLVKIAAAIIAIAFTCYRFYKKLEKSIYPMIAISQEIIERKNGIAVFRLTFHPGQKTIDIIRITAPGRKIQQAHIDKKLWDQPNSPGIVVIAFDDVYNPKASGPFTDAINRRIRILPEGIEKETKQLEIAISDVRPDETEAILKIKTEQSWFPQKFTVLLDTGN